MQPSPVRIASRHLASNTRRVIEDAIRPVYAGDPEDIDMVADRVVDHLWGGIQAVLRDPLKRVKVIKFGPTDEAQNSFDSDYSWVFPRQHFWAKVEYPTWVTLAHGIKLNIAKRWEEALHHARLANVPLSGHVLGAIASICTEVANEVAPVGPPGYRSFHDPFVIEKIDDAMVQRNILQTEAESYDLDVGGNQHDHSGTWEVDVRLNYRVDEVAVTAVPEGATQVLVRFNIKIGITFNEIVSPWAHNYMEPRP